MTEVLIDRTRVWLTRQVGGLGCRSASLPMVSPLVFSRTLSKTTTVSYSEYPRMVSRPITVAGVTSKPTRA